MKTTRRGRKPYEEDDTTFSADAYRVSGHGGIAWYVMGWELEAVAPWSCLNCNLSGFERDGGGGRVTDQGDRDCEHDICESDEPDHIRTDQVVCVMIGDDSPFVFDQEDLTPIERDEYCAGCGQIDCNGDAYEKELA